MCVWCSARTAADISESPTAFEHEALSRVVAPERCLEWGKGRRDGDGGMSLIANRNRFVSPVATCSVRERKKGEKS